MTGRVLFLDVDGVLNNASTKEKCCGFIGVDRELARLFMAWRRGRPDVEIVLSSTWRNHPEMWPDLHRAGVKWIAATPNLGASRGEEIQAYIDANKCERFAILDDDGDMLDSQKPAFVQTDDYFGVTAEDLQKLDLILMRSVHETTD